METVLFQEFPQNVILVEDTHTLAYFDNFLPAGGDFCWQMINFANRLDQDQDGQNVIGFLKEFSKKLILKKVCRQKWHHVVLVSYAHIIESWHEISNNLTF